MAIMPDNTPPMNEAMEQQDAALSRAKLREAAIPIVSRLSRLASEASAKRKDVETRWLEDMCQYSGVRDIYEVGRKPEGPPSSSEKAGSAVFVNITRPKTNRVEGRLCDILFPADDKNWGIEPTPSPDLVTIARRGMEEAQRAADELTMMESGTVPESQNGATPGELLSKAADLGEQAASAQATMDEAKRRSERMAIEIDDQLVECLYAQKSRDAISWACKLGVGILKGPVVMDSGPRKWQDRGDGQFDLAGNDNSARPAVECVSPWSFFPDPSASGMDDAEYVLERHLVSSRELRRMARNLGFDREVVKEILEQGADHGSGPDLQFLADIRLLTGETTPVTNRHVVWEYHGQLTVGEIATLIRARGDESAQEDAEAFEESADPLDDRMVIAFFCNDQLLKLSEYYPMDSGDLCYSVFSLEKGSASILGAIGVPRMMRDSQEVLNSAWRMMMDNAALSVGPQILADKSAIVPADGDPHMRPGKLWWWDSVNGGNTPFQTFNVPMNQAELSGIITLAFQFIDEETAMPRVAEGGRADENTPAQMPVGTMSMIMNAAGVNIRRMVKNWDDDVTAGMIRRIYDWNMQYSDKAEIKGDMSVEARGTSVLLTREMQAQHFATLASQWSVHPVLGPMLKPYDMARHTLQSLAINPSDVLVSEDEYNKKISDMAATEGEAPEDPQWPIRREIAQMQSADARYKADSEREVAMMRLAEASNQTLAKIDAQLEATRIKTASDERKLAAEVGMEERAAREARAMGRVPDGSGGAVSLGSEAP